ncbi:MAG TPA: DUF481 domain-containing protein [Edaphobacter sp.]|nr:DUF481 domain-containing protein [Edaphobacter sp.]
MSRLYKHLRVSRQIVWRIAIPCLLAGLFAQSSALLAQNKAADVIVFANGDQLTGTLERGVGDSVVFKNDAAGELTIPLSKIKEIHSQNSFVVIRKDQKIAKVTRPAGTLSYENGVVTLNTPTGAPETIQSGNLAFIVDKDTYTKEVIDHQGFLHGWNGAISGGATLIRSTQTGTSFTAGIALLRAIPTAAYLPPKNRTTFNLLETYGKLKQPVIPQTTPPSPPSEAKTSIFHTDAEHDIYFTPRFYVLGELSYDHNFAQGLNLQQVYGGGIGWTPIQSAVQQLDLKADVHYEMQTFIQPKPIDATHPRVPDQNLIGNTFGEAYHRNLPGKILFTQSASILPSWNNTDAYSAVAAAGLAIPAYKRFSLGLNATDNYLNLPSPGYKKNSFQFVTSIVYNLK